MARFSGYLTTMKKDVLRDLAAELKISNLDDDASRADLLDAVRHRLVTEPDLQNDARFEDVTGIVVKPRAKASANDSNFDTPGLAQDRSPVPSSGDTASPLKTVQKALSKASKAIREQADSLPEKAQEAGQLLVVATREKQREIAERVGAVGVSNAITEYAHEAERHVGSRARHVQATFSSAWVIISVTLLAEMLFIIAASIPLAARSFGPVEWLTRPWSPESPFTVTIPDLAVLCQYSILEPILFWVFSSIIVPLCAAHLVVFHKEKRSSKPTRENYLFGMKPPSPLTFSIIRLAMVYYLNEVAVEPLLSFKSDIIHRFASFQILVASVAIAFAIYEMLVLR